MDPTRNSNFRDCAGCRLVRRGRVKRLSSVVLSCLLRRALVTMESLVEVQCITNPSVAMSQNVLFAVPGFPPRLQGRQAVFWWFCRHKKSGHQICKQTWNRGASEERAAHNLTIVAFPPTTGRIPVVVLVPANSSLLDFQSFFTAPHKTYETYCTIIKKCICEFPP